MIEFSVLLPMFRAEHIGWLALEGLCRQEGVDFEWELVIAEEQHDETFGFERVKEYTERLEAAGCAHTMYIPVEGWMPLAQKFAGMFDHCSHESRIWTYNAADAYFPPKMLATQKAAFDGLPDGPDWFRTPNTVYYDIANGKAFFCKAQTRTYRGADAFVARRLDFTKHLSRTNTRRHGIDSWLLESYQSIAREKFGRSLNVQNDETDNWKHGLNTHGLNNISLGRAKHFSRCSVDITKTIPTDILDRLKEARKHMGQHRRGWPKKR